MDLLPDEVIDSNDMNLIHIIDMTMTNAKGTIHRHLRGRSCLMHQDILSIQWYHSHHNLPLKWHPV